MNWTKISGASLACVALVITACGGSDDETADTVLRNGKVVTLDANNSIQQAVAVRDGKIVFVGKNSDAKDWIGKNTQVIDLGGKMLMPGFVDGHMHSLAGGRALLICDLAYAPLSHAQLAQRLQACLDTSADKEPDTWLEAVNWDRQATNGIDGDPTKTVLDALTTSRPIAVTSSDFHAVLANTRAFTLAGVTAATPDPTGGKFLRDGAGNPSGISEDAAGWQVKAAIPPDTDEFLLQQGRAALQALRDQGITSFMDAAAGEAHAKTFKKLKDEGELTARVHLTYVMDAAITAADPKAAVAQAKAFVATTDQGEPQVAPGISAKILKVFMDGVVNAPGDTGAMLAPYFENQGTAAAPNWVPGTNMGEVYFPASVIKPMMLEAVDSGLDMHLHATGDRAVRETLDAVEYVRAQRPRADFRPAIAHGETVAVADYPRFAPLNVSATMSFQWAQRAPYSIGDTENHLGPDRFARMEPFGSLRNAGARVAFGSDWPIDPIDTFLALKVGVTRSGDPTNPHSAASIAPIFEGPINADPALSRIDALRAATIEAAYQLRLEKYVGSIEKGKFADLIALDKDFLRVPEEKLARNQVLMTMSGGRVVAAKDKFAALMTPSKHETRAHDRRLNINGSAGHAIVKGSPHGDGHNH
ncbi:hydrolase [Hydrogenophaga sp. A37]|nr:hydrolase [Hydrogenophaga sp. A37]